jgi:hypothetical protein
LPIGQKAEEHVPNLQIKEIVNPATAILLQQH